MQCATCRAPAVIRLPYAGRALCRDHFLRFFERRFKRELRKQLDALDLDGGGRIALALSGGKDSAVLTRLVHDALSPNPNYRFLAISVDEGIPGYRDQALEEARRLTDGLGIEFQVASHEEDHGTTTQAVAEAHPDQPPCAACGVFRRASLNRAARAWEADCVATGHNLDDAAETTLMNLLRGDVDQVLRTAPHDTSPAGLVPRITPLRDAPEREVALYAVLTETPFHGPECPHSTDATRRTYRALLLDLLDQDPSVRHTLLRLTDELKARVPPREDATGPNLCIRCGEPSAGRVCRACQMASQLVSGPGAHEEES
ncbi:MAG: TIGR00269 family protein [Candidatus Thermoplasmatota archaeon]|nr:TIGR00269 family protein [Candidatus Thermoplasmatota archaeon]